MPIVYSSSTDVLLHYTIETDTGSSQPVPLSFNSIMKVKRKINNLLYFLNFHYRVQKSPLLKIIASYMRLKLLGCVLFILMGLYQAQSQ